jgi:hypothetical protein
MSFRFSNFKPLGTKWPTTSLSAGALWSSKALMIVLYSCNMSGLWWCKEVASVQLSQADCTHKPAVIWIRFPAGELFPFSSSSFPCLLFVSNLHISFGRCVVLVRQWYHSTERGHQCVVIQRFLHINKQSGPWLWPPFSVVVNAATRAMSSKTSCINSPVKAEHSAYRSQRIS